MPTFQSLPTEIHIKILTQYLLITNCPYPTVVGDFHSIADTPIIKIIRSLSPYWASIIDPIVDQEMSDRWAMLEKITQNPNYTASDYLPVLKKHKATWVRIDYARGTISESEMRRRLRRYTDKYEAELRMKKAAQWIRERMSPW